MKCSFCDVPIKASSYAIAGLDYEVCICDSCAEKAHQLMEKYKLETQEKSGNSLEKEEIKKRLTPQEIKAHLDLYVIGQEKAKEILSVALYNHYKMLDNIDLDIVKEVEIEKSNVLLLGPTGSGKTFIVKTLAKLFDVPFAIVDANSITQAG